METATAPTAPRQVTAANLTVNGDQVTEAQYDAIVEWGIPDRSQLNRLAGIRQPTHGFLFQWPLEFADAVKEFLDA